MAVVILSGCARTYVAGQHSCPDQGGLPAGMQALPVARFHSAGESGVAYAAPGYKRVTISVSVGNDSKLHREYTLHGECIDWYPVWKDAGTLSVILFDGKGRSSLYSPGGLISTHTRILARYSYVFDADLAAFKEESLSAEEVRVLTQRHQGVGTNPGPTERTAR